MEIHYTGKVSKRDWIKALRLQNPQRNRQKWFFGGVFVLIIVMGIVSSLRNPSFLLETFRPLLDAPYVLLFPLVALTFPWWSEYLQAASFDQKGNIYLNNVHGIINETEVTIHGGGVQAAFKWNVFIDCKGNEEVFLLLHGPNNFSIFTPSLFTNQEEWQKFIALSKEKVGSTRNGNETNKQG